ncbi:hypothetical protein [Kocuria sp.]|uniref:hypothetical protein n=1 Tax=Kocuria sp. TaxID=1871328 RepID=UPI0026DFE104|nr:hypothetical protein [Kocuria sp.]MDO5618759.1 hypothetical protein [Kocuria sp.]
MSHDPTMSSPTAQVAKAEPAQEPTARGGVLQRRFGPKQQSGHPHDAKNSGFGRVIIAVYGIFALSAGVRAAYQIGTQFDIAPLAYLLSLFAALVYILAAVALTRTGATWHKVATVAVLIELVGVVGIGAWTYLAPNLFADATVWSHFGQGYGFIPLVLPFIGLWWLWRTLPSRHGTAGVQPGTEES